MFNLISNASRKCPEIQQKVSLNQSFAECQQVHGCEQQNCPLINEFTPKPIDILLTEFRLRQRG